MELSIYKTFVLDSYRKIISVIESCVTEEQFEGAHRMVNNFVDMCNCYTKQLPKSRKQRKSSQVFTQTILDSICEAGNVWNQTHTEALKSMEGTIPKVDGFYGYDE